MGAGARVEGRRDIREGEERELVPPGPAIGQKITSCALIGHYHYSPVSSEADTGDTAVRPGLVRVEPEPPPRDPGPGPCWVVDTVNPP